MIKLKLLKHQGNSMIRFTLLMFLMFAMSSSVLAMKAPDPPQAADQQSSGHHQNDSEAPEAPEAADCGMFKTETVFRQVVEVKKEIEINDVGNEKKTLKKNGFQKIQLPRQFMERLHRLHEKRGTSEEDNKGFINELADIVGRLPFEGSLNFTKEEDEDGEEMVRFYCYGGYLYDMPISDRPAINEISLGGAFRRAAHSGERVGEQQTEDLGEQKTEDGRPTKGAAYLVHIDRAIESPTLFPATFNDYLSHAYKEELEEKRIHLTNIWVPLKNYSARPLAFVDLQSVHPVKSSFKKPVSWDYEETKAIEVLFPQYDEKQQWFYYRDLKEGEAIAFDTLRTPHVAVKHPKNTGHKARHSIEIRSLSFTVRRKVLMDKEQPSEELLETFDVLQKIVHNRYNAVPMLPGAVLGRLKRSYCMRQDPGIQARSSDPQGQGVEPNCDEPNWVSQNKYPGEHELAAFDQRVREEREEEMRLRRDEQRCLMKRQELQILKELVND